jgi:hypothetical protein
MTTDRDEDARAPASACAGDEIVRFAYDSAAAAGLLQPARALLGEASRELSESFEQAVRAAGWPS